MNCCILNKITNTQLLSLLQKFMIVSVDSNAFFVGPVDLNFTSPGDVEILFWPGYPPYKSRSSIGLKSESLSSFAKKKWPSHFKLMVSASAS